MKGSRGDPPPSEPADAARLDFATGTAYDTTEPRTPYRDVTSYNNFYEFGVDKERPAARARGFRSRAALHVSVYVALDQAFDWRAVVADVAKRNFILVGFAAFTLLVPLAATSTNAAVRRLGYMKWKRVHTLVYPAAFLAVINFVWRVKKDLREPLVYGFILGALLLVRILANVHRRRQPRLGAAPPAIATGAPQ